MKKSNNSQYSLMNENIAVLIPCKNEEMTIEKVVNDFRKQLPQAMIYVFDNNSTDNSAMLALKSGGIVIPSSRLGKGNVIKHMFSTIDAEIYILVDGDDTYPSEVIHELLKEFKKSDVDMLVGTRLKIHSSHAFPRIHKFGNSLISGIISKLFLSRITDALSGYRIFSKKFVKNIYLTSQGFEIETEMTLQALIKNYNIKEIPISYSERPKGSVSKLNTFKDGMLIINTIIMIFKNYKPMTFFSVLSLISLILALIAGWFPILDYLRDQYVFHVPLAILAASLVLLSVLLFGIGLILNSILRYNLETHHQYKKN